MKIQVSIGFLTMLFIVLKLTDTIDWSWWWLVFILLFPLVVIFLSFLLVILFIFFAFLFGGKKLSQEIFSSSMKGFKKGLQNNARK